jgi:hypothetical protein
MDGLSPHIEYRVTTLQQEAAARRLAASATTAHSGPKPPRRSRRRLAIASAFLGLAVAGTSGAYLVVAAGAAPTAPREASPATVDEQVRRDPTGEIDRDILPLPPARGHVVHR